MLEKVFLPKLVGIVGDVFRHMTAIDKSSSKHMVLVNAVRDLSAPNPASAKFVSIASLVQQDIAGLKV
jgi:hypothetical protein